MTKLIVPTKEAVMAAIDAYLEKKSMARTAFGKACKDDFLFTLG
jgi:hypothetical protein